MKNGIFSQGLWGFINKEGEVIIEPKFKSISDFDGGYAQINESKNNYIDKSGNLILIHKFNYKL